MDERLEQALQNLDVIDKAASFNVAATGDDEKVEFLARIAALEDEADLLAVANSDLRRENAFLREKIASLESIENTGGEDQRKRETGTKEATQASMFTLPGLLVDEEKSQSGYIQKEISRKNGVCDKSNPICVAFGTRECFLSLSEWTSLDDPNPDTDCLVHVGGADRKLYTYFYRSHDHSWILASTIDVPAPILSVECFGTSAICALMDGNLAIVDIGKAARASTGENGSNEGISLQKNTTKYLSRATFSKDGRTIAAVCPNERKVVLYREEGGASGWGLGATLTFEKAPESAAFATTADASEEVLVVALRESAHLVAVVIGAETGTGGFKEYLIPLNENSWDDHPSFSALSVSLPSTPPSQGEGAGQGEQSGTGRVFGPLLVSTDKGSHLLLVWKPPTAGVGSGDSDRAGEQAGRDQGKTREICKSERLATLTGHSCSDYGKPSVAWAGSAYDHQHRAANARFIYSNSEGESLVYVYDSFRGRTAAATQAGAGTGQVDTLSAHKGIVRGLALHHSLGLLVSVSYDRSMIMWSLSE